MDAARWTIPASTMKTGRQFTVPLGAGTLDVLERTRKLSDGSPLVFPSRTGRMLAPKTVSSVLGSPMWIRRCTGFLEAAASAKGSFRAIRGSSGYLRAVESPQIDDLRSPRGTGRVESDHPRRETGPGRPARDVPAPLHTTSPEIAWGVSCRPAGGGTGRISDNIVQL